MIYGQQIKKLKETLMSNPSGRNYWNEFVKLNVGNKGDPKLPEVSPEDRNQLSGKKLWQQMYKDMTIFEKGTFNATQRKKESHSATQSATKKKLRY